MATHSSNPFFFLIFILTLLYFTILYWFCHTLTWIHHGYTCVPKYEPSSHLPPHNISLGHPCAPAPSMLYPASDIDWLFVSYMIVYMFQCHSPKSSHSLPFPKWLCHFTIPPGMCEDSSFTTSSPALAIISLFDYSHYRGLVMVFHCAINLHFPNN